MVDRVRYLIEVMHKTQQDFARLIGIDPSNMSKILSGQQRLTARMARRIVANTGVSESWLFDGADVPFPRTTAGEPRTVGPGGHLIRIDDNGPVEAADCLQAPGAPVYDVDVTAGAAELSEMFTDDRIVGYLDVPQLTSRHPVVRVSGDSMSPRIRHGSYVQIRPVSDLGVIFWGNIYVVVLDDYRMVKVVRRHADPELVILHSINPEYDDMEIPRRAIRKLYIVESVLNYDILA